MKKIIHVALVLIIVITLSACGTETTTSTGENSKPEKTENKTSDTSAGQWSKIGKSVSVDGVQYTINAYKKSKKSELFTAQDGQSFLLIDMMVKNNNAEEAPLSSITMFELTDADGKEYKISLGGFSCLEEEKIEQADGSVAASSEKRYGLAYEVPENAKGLKLSVKELLGDGKQIVELY